MIQFESNRIVSAQNRIVSCVVTQPWMELIILTQAQSCTTLQHSTCPSRLLHRHRHVHRRVTLTVLPKRRVRHVGRNAGRVFKIWIWVTATRAATSLLVTTMMNPVQLQVIRRRNIVTGNFWKSVTAPSGAAGSAAITGPGGVLGLGWRITIM